MSMETNAVIRRLAGDARPVRPLASPWTRTALWLALAAPYVALVIVLMSPRPDLGLKFSEPRFLIEEGAALATGIAAALAAFATVIPGFDRKFLLTPVFPAAIWLGSLGEGCVRQWLVQGSAGLSLQSDWMCLPAIVIVGLVPAIGMVAMLRRGAPMMPCVSIGLAGLAAAGLGDFGLRFFHPQDASLMVLVWQVGSVVLLSAAASCTGRYLLSWRTVIGRTLRGVPVR